MKMLRFSAVAMALLTLSSLVRAAGGQSMIDFEGLQDGVALGSQYEALGVTFRANAFSGAGSSGSGKSWATNTDMTVLDIALQGEEAELVPGPFASGKVLRAYELWLDEDGDPSFELLFAKPMLSVSASFASVSTDDGQAADTRLFAYSGATLLGVVSGNAVAAQTAFSLSFSAPDITRVVIAPGSYNDWVAVDNIAFTPAVPEPDSWLLVLAGIGALGLMRSRRMSSQSDPN